MTQSLTRRATAFIIRELIGELLFFPVWWYSQGLVATWRTIVRQWLATADRLSLRILLKNIGKPMYADYTRSGRIISFFFRLLLIGVRSVVLLLWTVILGVAMATWIVGPIMAAGLLLRQIVPV